jgi:glycerophosphoryl diester phosphodiesterase
MKKIKIPPHRRTGIATIAVSFVVFATTFFALAQSQNGNSLFLDSDQDGLTDQEEKMIGTDPFKADTDGDGYSDGKEVESGYDPLRPAPGDKIVPGAQSSSISSGAQSSAAATTSSADSASSTQDLTSKQTELLGTDAMTDLSSDPNNPNLTNEMIGQLMQLTTNKAATDSSFADNPTFSSDDIAQMTQGALQTVDLTKSMPDIQDSDINLLPEVKDKNLSADEIKAKQKTEIEKYLSQTAFVLASNSPFPVEDPTKLESQVASERDNLIAALTSNDTQKIDAYASSAQTGIDQLKKIETPYILKDIHKSTLQLALYTLNLKGSFTLNATDPMKSLAAVSSLQAVAQKSIEIQDQFSKILSDYGIDAVNFP